MFSLQFRCLPTWPMSGFPLQKYTHFPTAQSHTNVCVIVKKKLWRDLCKSLFFFLSVYVIVKGVWWCERNGFTRRRRVFMRLQLCSSLRGLHVKPMKSRVLWQTCKVLCLDASFPFIIQPTSGFVSDKTRLTNGRHYKTFNSVFKNNSLNTPSHWSVWMNI